MPGPSVNFLMEWKTHNVQLVFLCKIYFSIYHNTSHHVLWKFQLKKIYSNYFCLRKRRNLNYDSILDILFDKPKSKLIL